MKKLAPFILCLAILSAGTAYGAIVFSENFETGSSPFSFAFKWTKSNAYNEGALVTENGNRFWREIFKPGSTDTYFGFTNNMNGIGSGNKIYFKFKVRYGDASHPYSWATANRSHELKFPDLCPGQNGYDAEGSRVIGLHRRGSDDRHGIFRVFTYMTSTGETWTHDLPTQLAGNTWYTIQFCLVDNGAAGDVVKIWCNNDNESSPNYSYTSTGNIFNSSQWWRTTTEWAYRNHEVASNQYFYYDDIQIGTTFISGSGGTTPPPACSYSLSASSSSVDAAAHTGSFSVTSGTGCAWTAVSNASWITVTSGASGSGNGTVAYSVAANSATSQRTGTITAAGRTFSITQAAATSSCSYSLSASSANFDAAAHTGSFNVTTSNGCTWSATPSASWITVTSGASGSGNGTVAYSVSANSGSSRTGSVTVAGRTFTITQASGAAACTYGVTPTSVNFDSAAHTGSFNVTSATGCAWTAASNTSWITITSGRSGAGAGTVNYSLSANTSSSQRTGTITAAGMTFTVRQAAAATPPPASCTYTIANTSALFNSDAHTGTVGVNTSSSSCTWTAVSNVDWITITAGGSGTGAGTVYFSVEKNSRFFQRIGTLTIAGKTYTVRQGSVLSNWLSNPNLRPPQQLRVQ